MHPFTDTYSVERERERERESQVVSFHPLSIPHLGGPDSIRSRSSRSARFTLPLSSPRNRNDPRDAWDALGDESDYLAEPLEIVVHSGPPSKHQEKKNPQVSRRISLSFSRSANFQV